MMYSEFVEGTGCKDNAHNHEVFKNLEVMYMNTNMSKAEIYEYGKKLVDNSKSEAELKLEAEIKAEITEEQEKVAYNKMQVEYWTEQLRYWKSIKDDWMISHCKTSLDYHKRELMDAKNRIAALKWVLG